MRKGVLEQQIRQVLAIDDQSRNDDKRLTQVVWYKFYRQYITDFHGTLYVSLNSIKELPSQDNIKRIRATRP